MNQQVNNIPDSNHRSSTKEPGVGRRNDNLENRGVMNLDSETMVNIRCPKCGNPHFLNCKNEELRKAA